MENRMSRNVSTIYEDLGVNGIRYCSMLISLASGGQARVQEAAVQQIFHLERSSFFSALMVRT